MFVVVCKGIAELELSEWKPREEDEYAVDEAEARDRFRRLLEAGQKGEEVEGVVPWMVAIFDADKKPPKRAKASELEGRGDELLTQRDERIMLSMYADGDDEPCGPWARMVRTN